MYPSAFFESSEWLCNVIIQVFGLIRLRGSAGGPSSGMACGLLRAYLLVDLPICFLAVAVAVWCSVAFGAEFHVRDLAGGLLAIGTHYVRHFEFLGEFRELEVAKGVLGWGKSTQLVNLVLKER